MEVNQQSIFPAGMKKAIPPENLAELYLHIVDPSAQSLIEIINKDFRTAIISNDFEYNKLVRLATTAIKLLNLRVIEDGMNENGVIEQHAVPATPKTLNIVLGLLFSQLHLSCSKKGEQLKLIFEQRAKISEKYEDRSKKQGVMGIFKPH